MPLITRVLKPEQFTAEKLAEVIEQCSNWDIMITGTILERMLDRLVSEGILGTDEPEAVEPGQVVKVKGLA